ncbi:MAG TPA: hypothetical protein VHO68_14570 [Bacteroidales bacterium]|nr:hypothetical protein [Bacteroidales bacterium]
MKRNIISILTALFFLFAFQAVNGQAENTNTQIGSTKDKQTGMGMSGSLQNCMDQIASDSTMRGQMMSRMLERMHGDSAGMQQLCRKMMDNPDMRKTMMKMMNRSGMGSVMQGQGSMGQGSRDSRQQSGTGVNGSGKDLMKGSDHILDTVKVIP